MANSPQVNENVFFFFGVGEGRRKNFGGSPPTQLKHFKKYFRLPRAVLIISFLFSLERLPPKLIENYGESCCIAFLSVSTGSGRGINLLQSFKKKFACRAKKNIGAKTWGGTGGRPPNPPQYPKKNASNKDLPPPITPGGGDF